MNEITLRGVIPAIFSQQPATPSDLWRKEVRFARGKYYLIEAASGKGKTSLCSYIYGYRDDYEGSILFDGNDIRPLTRSGWGDLHRRSLGLLFQGLRLFPELTALENVQLKNRITAHQTDGWIREAFERLDIADKLDTPAAKISFGQQQRVALIRGLCQPLDFLLLDEPVSHLDEENSRHAADLLLQEATRHGFGIIGTSIGKHLQLPYHQTLQL